MYLGNVKENIAFYELTMYNTLEVIFLENYSFRQRDTSLFISRQRDLHPKPGFFDKHTHTRYEILFFLDGDATEVIEGRKYKLKKYDLIFLRPGEYHFLQIDSSADYDRYVLYFDPAEIGIDPNTYISANTDIWNCRHRAIIQDLFKRFDYYHSTLDENTFLDMCKLLIKELIYNLSIEADLPEPDRLQNSHPIINSALEEINANLFAIKNISDVASKLYVTESYLYRIFKQELKTTPYKYICEKRLYIAHSLINQGQAPTHVYRECGFNDYTSFYRSYVKLFGHAPSK